MKEIHNFLSDEEFQFLTEGIYYYDFPWFRGLKVQLDMNPSGRLQHQLSHMFLHKAWNNPDELFYSDYFKIVKPFADKFVKKIKAKRLLRLKLNLGYSNGIQEEGGWHTDFDDKNNKIAILYLNTNNGYTLLEDGTKIASVKNKLALFDNVSHTDVTCTDTEERVVLNIGYTI
tara:strand:+ start:2440 stop:2958 length:519 start_codon:yes stop_codon:yes gene_type:complete